MIHREVGSGGPGAKKNAPIAGPRVAENVIWTRAAGSNPGAARRRGRRRRRRSPSSEASAGFYAPQENFLGFIPVNMAAVRKKYPD